MNVLLFIFSLIYFPLVIITGIVWFQGNSGLEILTFLLWQLIMGKTVFEIVRMTITLLTRNKNIPRLDTLKNFPKVALLYVCRDDIVPECLLQLGQQNYNNYDIFVLDDSQKKNNRTWVDSLVRQLKISLKSQSTMVKILRRGSVEGYKAGNINHWLANYGGGYKFFAIFDNDSKASANFLMQMLLYAEHPVNESVAIFQSKVYAWNTAQRFARLMSATAPISMQIIHNIGNKTGTVISFGHNNLHRTSTIQDIGNFPEKFTSEDAAITLELSQEGYRTVLVDVESYEAEPIDINKYRRRAVRWANQTAALFQQSWHKVPWELKFEISRQLFYYLINSLFFVWVLVSLWYNTNNWQLSEIVVQYVSILWGGNTTQMLLIVFILGLIILQFAIHFLIALRVNVSILDYFGHMFASLLVYLFTIIPITKALVGGLLGKSIAFQPSNTASGNVSIVGLYSQIKLLCIFAAITILQHIWLLENPWSYLGGWWATFIVFTPLGIYYIHESQLLERKHHERKRFIT